MNKSNQTTMQNIEPHQPTQIEPRMTLDQTNQLMLECQKRLPLFRLLQVKTSPDTFLGLQRDQSLSIMGYSRKEIEEMTGFKRKKRAKRDRSDEIYISDRDLPLKGREFLARLKAEGEVLRWGGLDEGKPKKKGRAQSRPEKPVQTVGELVEIETSQTIPSSKTRETEANIE